MEIVSAIPSAKTAALSITGCFPKLPVSLILSGNTKNLTLPALMVVIAGSRVPGSQVGGCFKVITVHFISVHFSELSGCLVYSGQKRSPDRYIQFRGVAILIENLSLTHNQQPYAFIENVITDEKFRKRGLATQCLNYAKEIAIKENCYKMMLLTGSKEISTLDFYRKAGYNSDDKTAFIQWI